jgi:hypothetical protein
MLFASLVEKHPEILRDRAGLSFTDQAAPATIAAAFATSGVVKLRGALPAAALQAGRDAFQGFGSDGDSWHWPWAVRAGQHFPMATVFHALLKSWAWRVIERLCRSQHIAIPLSGCIARHAVDMPLGLGAHQDAFGFGPALPFSVWIPLQTITPLEDSGLGFIVPALDHVVSADSPANVGADLMLSDPGKLWIPTYELGDITIHSNLSAHFTTGYGTRAHRYSLEIRALPRLTAPRKHLDPAIYVARRDGRAVVAGTRYVGKTEAVPLLESVTAQA